MESTTRRRGFRRLEPDTLIPYCNPRYCRIAYWNPILSDSVLESDYSGLRIGIRFFRTPCWNPILQDSVLESDFTGFRVLESRSATRPVFKKSGYRWEINSPNQSKSIKLKITQAHQTSSRINCCTRDTVTKST